MTNTELLKESINNRGIKIKFIAEKLGITTTGLSKKMNNEIEFKATEIQIICDILNINDLKLKNRIFFANKVDK